MWRVMNLKTFTEVTAPKSYVSANSTTPAYEQPEDTFDCYLFY